MDGQISICSEKLCGAHCNGSEEPKEESNNE